MQQSSMQSVLTNAFEYFSDEIKTAIPCVVLAVDLKNNKVDVKPSVKQLFKDGSSIDFPTIYNVPIVFPCTKRSGVTFPIAVGDSVLCVFSMRGLDNFKRGNGYPSSPTDLRKFSMRDAVAIPGLLPTANSLNNPSNRSLPHDANDVVLAHNIGTGNECEYRLKSNGDVSVKAKNYSVVADNISMTGTTTITGNISTTGTLTNNGAEVGSDHRHAPSTTPPSAIP
jgi:hypothetical protein